MNPKRRLRPALLGVALALLAAPAMASDNPEVINEWNQLLQANIPSTASLQSPRYYAMMHIAMFDAANAIERKYRPYRSRVHGHPNASQEAAVAQAAHDVLSALIPNSKAAFDAALNSRLEKMHPWRGAEGGRIGRKVAAEIIAWRANDGEANPSATPYVVAPLPGLWQPTPPALAPATSPNWRDVQPFALLTATQFLPDPPPTLMSEEYARDFEEVKLLGAANSSARTAEQTQLARLFASVGNGTQHWAMWNNVARDAARSQHFSLLDTARLFALVNASIHDGLQTAHVSKFVYGFWRPLTAIRRADEDLNAQTVADPAWTPLLTTPPYPSHSSNQTCVGTSAARALERALGTDAAPFSVTWIGTAGNANVTRSYEHFSDLAAEQAHSRVYGGIHFTFELTASQESCTKVADYVFENYMRPRHGRHD